jgi:hypothetical protein
LQIVQKLQIKFVFENLEFAPTKKIMTHRKLQPFSMQQKYRYLKNETHNTKISADLGALCSTVEQHIVCSTVEQHIVINILN